MNEPIRIGHTDPAPPPPRAPAKLGAAGVRLWRSVAKRYELTLSELTLLEGAAKLTDEIVRLEKALANAPTLITGSAGQEKVHPAFAELRAHRLALARLMQALDLDGAERDAASAAGRHLAHARHRGKGAI